MCARLPLRKRTLVLGLVFGLLGEARTSAAQAQLSESQAAEALQRARDDSAMHHDPNKLGDFYRRIQAFPPGRSQAEAWEFLALRYREGLHDARTAGTIDQQLVRAGGAPTDLREGALARLLQDTSAWGEGLTELARHAPNATAEESVRRAIRWAWLVRISCLFPLLLLAWAACRKRGASAEHRGVHTDASVLIGAVAASGVLVAARVEGGTAGPFLWLTAVFALHVALTLRIKRSTTRPRGLQALAGLAFVSMLASSFLIIAVRYPWILAR
jgi:hypothetical protein